MDSPHQSPVDRHRNFRVLIIEDEPLIAHTLEDALIDACFQIAGVVGKLENALALIESGACDVAIIDANLAGLSASPAAIALASRGLPFIVTSGYSQEQLPGSFPGAVFIQKPYRPELIIQTLDALFLDR